MQTKYDELIKNATLKYLEGVDWRLLKAQLCQESSLNPDAQSHAGAMGIAQFMPPTWADMQNQLKMGPLDSAYDPEKAIPAAAYYMRQLCKQWKAPRPEADRYMLALSSYNAGIGNILKAQRRANNVADYYKIITELPNITGVDNATETRNYVKYIFRIFGEYLMTGR